MANIVKGEQYSVAFLLRANGSAVTPENINGVRIMLGDQMATYPDGALTYSSDDGTWRFPLTQETTYKIVGSEVSYQAQIKIADRIYSRKPQTIKVDDTMFRTEWV